MKTPLIITCFGDSYFLPHVLLQAKFSNPDKRIILLGDSRNRHYDSVVEWHDLAGYNQQAGAFADNYVHLSPNNYAYELFCFQRWLIIWEFMKAQQIDRAWCLDSDVMIYRDLSRHEQRLSQFSLSYSDVSGGVCLINDFGFFGDFCQTMIDAYRQEAELKKLQEHLLQPIHPKLSGVVSDMYFFAKAKRDGGQQIGDLSQPVDGWVFDSNIYLAEDMETKAGAKAIYWENQQPYGRYLTGEKVNFTVLHFAAKAGKKLIKQHYRGGANRLGLRSRFIHWLYTSVPSRALAKIIKYGMQIVRRGK